MPESAKLVKTKLKGTKMQLIRKLQTMLKLLDSTMQPCKKKRMLLKPPNRQLRITQALQMKNLNLKWNLLLVSKRHLLKPQFKCPNNLLFSSRTVTHPSRFLQIITLGTSTNMTF